MNTVNYQQARGVDDMKTKWLPYVKTVLIAIAACVCVLLGGAALVSALIMGEVLRPEHADYLLPVVLLSATLISCVIVSMKSDTVVYMNAGLGALTAALVTLTGSFIVNDGGERNILGTLLVIAAGAALFMMLKLKKKDGRMGNVKIAKMVNLYKKQGG